jgi:hypothetical protein
MYTLNCIRRLGVALLSNIKTHTKEHVIHDILVGPLHSVAISHCLKLGCTSGPQGGILCSHQ